MTTHILTGQRWYREPWPWLLMAGPAVVVIAGIITTYLAVASSDGLVADDYYKRGLAINQTLSRDSVARREAYRAHVELAESGRIQITLEGRGALPAQLTLRLAHGGRAALDRTMAVPMAGSGRYSVTLPPLASGRWQITLEDPARSWRLTGSARMPANEVLDLVAPGE